MNIFSFQTIDPQKDKDLQDAIFRLRYDIYCCETGFLPSEQYPTKREIDKYDADAIHFAAISDAGDLIGAVRLVVNNDNKNKYPLEEYCKNLWFDRERDLKPEGFKLAEISRLVVDKKFRRRAEDGLFGVESYPSADRRRRQPQIVLGLYRQIYYECKQLGITHWYAAMERKLNYALKRFSFHFVQIGPETDYYGPVIPYMGEIQIIEEMLFRERPGSTQGILDGLGIQFWPETAKKIIEYNSASSDSEKPVLPGLRIVDEILSSIDNLKMLGQSSLRLIELARNPAENFDDIIQVVETDPGLTANFLKLCNSSYFGLPKKIDSVRRGIILLGVGQIIKIIWANLSTLSPLFHEEHEGYQLDYGELWEHCVSTAIISQMLLKKAGRREDPLLFTAALLHDIGKIVLDQYIQQHSNEFRSLCDRSVLGYPQIEKAYFGIDHAELGGKIAEKWNFPEDLQRAIKNHHNFLVLPKPSELDVWTGVSNIVSHFVEAYGGIHKKRTGVTICLKEGIIERINLTQQDVTDVLKSFPEELKRVLG